MDELSEMIAVYAGKPQEHSALDKAIMVIDDEPGVRRSLTTIFNKRGYGVSAYRSGDEALKHLDESVRVVILDIKLPKIAGDVVYKKIKERYDIPIIFHSAYPGEQVEDCMRLRPFDYIDKGTPDSLERLCGAVERALHG